MKKISKREAAIAIMTDNAGRPMAEVLEIIAAEISVSLAGAKSYYVWIVANGRAPGVVEKATRARKEAPAKAPRVKAERPAKKATEKAVASAKKVATHGKTEEELAQIKLANLERMREVAKKFKARKVIEVADEGEVELTEEGNGFEPPAFLSHSELKFMI